jgi:hypothetical protein
MCVFGGAVLALAALRPTDLPYGLTARQLALGGVWLLVAGAVAGIVGFALGAIVIRDEALDHAASVRNRWAQRMLEFRNKTQEITRAIDSAYAMYRGNKPLAADWRAYSRQAAWIPKVADDPRPLSRWDSHLSASDAPPASRELYAFAKALVKPPTIDTTIVSVATGERRPGKVQLTAPSQLGEFRRYTMTLMHELGMSQHEAGMGAFMREQGFRKNYYEIMTLLAYTNVATAAHANSEAPGNSDPGFWTLGESFAQTVLPTYSPRPVTLPAKPRAPAKTRAGSRDPNSPPSPYYPPFSGTPYLDRPETELSEAIARAAFHSSWGRLICASALNAAGSINCSNVVKSIAINTAKAARDGKLHIRGTMGANGDTATIPTTVWHEVDLEIVSVAPLQWKAYPRNRSGAESTELYRLMSCATLSVDSDEFQRVFPPEWAQSDGDRLRALESARKAGRDPEVIKWLTDAPSDPRSEFPGAADSR